ncbi:hypothetical protein [Clostridium beijerinckii]|nr:hypothetical protein [Clostridium beijerinckii]NOW03235.1 hypothetical protein [Clostridium beijerinckii]NRT78115.1 hypothetical protein [Clostridium beijerinckii]NYC03623.1 hypothetical protein [Clostridium beijerinckii]
MQKGFEPDKIINLPLNVKEFYMASIKLKQEEDKQLLHDVVKEVIGIGR